MELATTPAELKAIIDDCRRHIATDRELYKYYESVFVPWYTKQWDSTKKLLIASAHFWRCEMLRAKHNTARYMRGEEPVLRPKYVGDAMQDVSTELEHMASHIEEMSRFTGQLAVISEHCLDSDAESILNTVKYIERHTYGG